MHPPTALDHAQIKLLESKSVDDLLELLGAQTLAFTQNPIEIANDVQGGALTRKHVPALGVWEECQHLISLGRGFLQMWSSELKAAICSNDELYKKEREYGNEQLYALVGAAATSLAAAIPALAPLGGILTVVGVIVAKSGVSAFCKDFVPKNDEK